MILTVTMNPSIDISYPLVHLQLDTVNRVKNISKTAGGKGLNVSRVLHQLDKEILATGIVGGYLGEAIKEKLAQENIPHDFTKIKEESRNSIAILHDTGQQTEILEQGPTVTPKEEAQFLHHYQQLLKKSSTVTISGSLAAGLSMNLYEKMIELASQNHIPVLLDTSGNPLKQALTAKKKPFLVKPNETEIAELLGESLATDEKSILSQLKRDIFSEVEWVVVSQGAEGALAKHGNHFYRVTIPAINVVNPVGSGDATLAGLAAMIDDKETDETILKMGMTAGMLNAMEPKTGWIDKQKVMEYFQQVTVTKLTPF